jgi:6-phosphogluconolactonase
MNVAITCTTTYSVGGVMSGLIGAGLVLENNGGGDLSATNGSFEFSSIASGATFAITVKSQPLGPGQTCVPTNATGTVGSTDFTDVKIVCTLAPGRFAYFANQSASPATPGQVASYVIDAVSGKLTGTGEILNGTAYTYSSVSLSPKGDFAYVTDSSTGNLSLYAADNNSGRLSLLSAAAITLPKPVAAGQPTTFTVNATGAFAYYVALMLNLWWPFLLEGETALYHSRSSFDSSRVSEARLELSQSTVNHDLVPWDESRSRDSDG